MNLLLFGFKRCGKTYLGLKVAQKMHMHFLDTDQMIEDLFTARHHKTLACREIVHDHGIHFFRELEKQVIYSLENTTNTVIALGGGSVLDQANARAYRRGQDRPVTNHNLFYSETIEERMIERVNMRRALSETALLGTDVGPTFEELRAAIERDPGN